MGFKHLINSKKTLTLFAVFVLFGTNLMAQTSAQGDMAPVDKGAMWTGIAYYALLLLVAAFCVGIVGKILRVYDLTQKMQGKKGINWSGVMGVCCAIFLVVGGYGAYWSLTVQGGMSLPESASAGIID